MNTDKETLVLSGRNSFAEFCKYLISLRLLRSGLPHGWAFDLFNEFVTQDTGLWRSFGQIGQPEGSDREGRRYRVPKISLNLNSLCRQEHQKCDSREKISPLRLVVRTD